MKIGVQPTKQDDHRKYTNLATELRLHDKDPNHNNILQGSLMPNRNLIHLKTNVPRKLVAKYEL